MENNSFKKNLHNIDVQVEGSKELKFSKQMLKLYERLCFLETIVTQLVKERKYYDTRIEEIFKQSEKLEKLEWEIERRREALVNQEIMFRDRVLYAKESFSIAADSKAKGDGLVFDKDSMGETNSLHEILEKIPRSIAIVQRGIVKQINQSFAMLLGYEVDEIIDKNLFDFVAPDGIADIKKYYVDRLKGSNVSTYETVFLTKDNNKIVVEVNINPTTYNNKKADIFVFNALENP